MTGLTIAMTATAAFAASPSVLIEGVLNSKGGGPVADGSYSIAFSVWDKQADGTKAWSETAKVNVKGGAFSHALGSVTPIAVAVFAKLPEAWLGAKVESDPELPRKALHAGAYALVAATAQGIACTGCVGTSALKADGNLDLGTYALTAAKVTAQTATLGSVVAVSFQGDGSKLTGLPLPKGQCKTGEVVVGIKADGSLACGGALDLKNLPANALKAISGGALTNQFSDTLTSTKAPVDIKDNFPSGVTDTIDVPDLGIAENLRVHVNIVGTSGIAGLRVLLFDPTYGPLPVDISKNGADLGASYVLHDKSGAGSQLTFTYPPTKTVKGDLNEWQGKNPKGKWSLVVIDTVFQDNGTDGKLNTWYIEVDTIADKKIQATGTVVVGTGLQLPVVDKPPFACTAKTRGLTYIDKATDQVRICRKSGLWGTFAVFECGNKTLESGETCDDGNNTAGDGCDPVCIKECGNGKLDLNEDCDPNDAATKANCTADCKKISFGKLWFESTWTEFYPVKYPHDTYKESLAVATCKAAGLRLWRDESGDKNDPSYAYDYNGQHNLGGHDICYKVNSATTNNQQSHTGTWKLFGSAWSTDIREISGAANNVVVYILNHQAHGGTVENGASYCRIRPQSGNPTWIDQTNGQPTGMKDNAIVLCAKHK